MVTDISWEEKELGVILCETYTVLKKKNFLISQVMINTRDGGGISYSNKFGTKSITFLFLPSYEILVEIKPPLIFLLPNVLSFVFFKREMIKSKTISMRKAISHDRLILDYRRFIHETFDYLEVNKII